MTRLAYFAFATSILAGGAACFAATKTYAAPGSSTFSDPLAWSPTGAPADTDSILLGNAIASDATITIDSGGVVAATTVDTSHNYSIALASGGSTVFNAGALDLAAGTLTMAPGGSNTFRAASLTIASIGARLDLHDNSAIFDFNYTSTASEATLRDAIYAGAIKGDVTATSRLGYATAQRIFPDPSNGTFAGQSVTSPSGLAVLLRQTLAGDTDLNGVVEFDDLLALAMNYGYVPAGGQTWSRGDFNYDGIINFDDLLALSQNYNRTYLPSSSELTSLGGPAFAADWALAQSLVPEPSLLALLASAMPFARRRR